MMEREQSWSVGYAGKATEERNFDTRIWSDTQSCTSSDSRSSRSLAIAATNSNVYDINDISSKYVPSEQGVYAKVIDYTF